MVRRSRSFDSTQGVLLKRQSIPGTSYQIPPVKSRRTHSDPRQPQSYINVHMLTSMPISRPLSIAFDRYESDMRSPVIGHPSPVDDIPDEKPVKRNGLFSNVFEAEKSLWALSMSVFFAVTSKFRRHFILFNLFVLAPIFLTVTMCLSGWVALFAAFGHFFLPDDNPPIERKYTPTSPVVTSPRLSPYASNDSLYDEQRPQLINQQSTGPRLWSRRTSVQHASIQRIVGE